MIKKEMIAMLLAGGQGSRLGVLTSKVAKPAVAFGGKYRIIEKVGTGGMGGIYRAEHSMIGRIVALKVIRSHLLDDELQQKRFRQEAQAASQLLHPNAVTLFDFGVEDKLPYLVKHPWCHNTDTGRRRIGQ